MNLAKERHNMKIKIELYRDGVFGVKSPVREYGFRVTKKKEVEKMDYMKKQNDLEDQLQYFIEDYLEYFLKEFIYTTNIF